MQSKLLSFLFKLFLLSIITATLFYFTEEKIPSQFQYQPYPGLLLFFVIVTFLLHTGYENSFKKSSKHFVRFYMLASGLKLFGFMTILILFAFLDKEHIVGFAIHFLALYFIYTAFELIISYKKFGTDAKQ